MGSFQSNLHTKVVTILKPPCCISKIRFISYSHVASLLHFSYWICSLRSTQLITLIFLIVLSHVKSPSLNCVSCCLKYHKALLFSLYTTHLREVIGIPDIKFHFYSATPSCLFICLIKLQPWLLTTCIHVF